MINHSVARNKLAVDAAERNRTNINVQCTCSLSSFGDSLIKQQGANYYTELIFPNVSNVDASRFYCRKNSIF
jgi:hypothetical protein